MAKKVNSIEPIIKRLSELQGGFFVPPDNGDHCWSIKMETYTRKEVCYLLWSQIAMIRNDIKSYAGESLTPNILDVIDNPRIPDF